MATPQEAELAALRTELAGAQETLKATRSELAEAREALEAIRTGAVDALVVAPGPGQERVFTLEGADFAYRALVERMHEGAATLSRTGTVLYANRSLAELLGRPLEEVIGAAFHQFFLPAGDPWILEMQAECLTSGSESCADALVRRSDGGLLPVTLAFLAFEAYGSRTLCVTVTDLSKHLELARARARQEHEELLQRENATLEALVQARTEDLQRTLEELQASERKFRNLADFTYDWEYWQDEEGRFVYVSPSCERISGHPTAAFLEDPGLQERLLHPEDRARVLAETDLANRQSRVCELEFRIVTAHGDLRWLGQTSQPVLDREGAWAGRRGSNRDITEYKRTEEALRESAAMLQRVSAQLISAQEEERRRVARELHDSLGSSLTAIKYIGERALDGVCAKGRAGHMTGMQTFVQVIQDAMTDLRRISMNLRPSLLDDLGLVATLSWFTREFQVAHPGIQVEQVVGVEETAIPEALKISLYRILQEAMNNAAKYSQAARVFLSLERKDGALHLQVADDGVGFEVTARPKPTLGGGHGLDYMRERAELSGGGFALESSPGQGTRISAWWPLPSS